MRASTGNIHFRSSSASRTFFVNLLVRGNLNWTIEPGDFREKLLLIESICRRALLARAHLFVKRKTLWPAKTTANNRATNLDRENQNLAEKLLKQTPRRRYKPTIFFPCFAQRLLWRVKRSCVISALYLFAVGCAEKAKDFLLLSVCLSYWPLVSINYTRNSLS